MAAEHVINSRRAIATGRLAESRERLMELLGFVDTPESDIPAATRREPALFEVAKLENLATFLEKLLERLSEMTTEDDSSTNELDELRARLEAEIQRTKTEFLAVLDSRDATIADKNDAIREREAQIESLNAQLVAAQEAAPVESAPTETTPTPAPAETAPAQEVATQAAPAKTTKPKTPK